MLKQIVWKISTGCNNLAYYNVVVRAPHYGTLCCQGHCNSRKALLMGTSIGLTLMKPMCALWQHVYGIWKGATGFPTRVGILSIKFGLECWSGVWPWNMIFGAEFWSENLESCLGVGFCPYFSEGLYSWASCVGATAFPQGSVFLQGPVSLGLMCGCHCFPSRVCFSPRACFPGPGSCVGATVFPQGSVFLQGSVPLGLDHVWVPLFSLKGLFFSKGLFPWASCVGV